MIIVTMKIQGEIKTQSQYCWKIGEPFPILHAWLERVERLYADGEELERLKMLVPVAEPRASALEIEGAGAAYACEILLASYKH